MGRLKYYSKWQLAILKLYWIARVNGVGHWSLLIDYMLLWNLIP